MDGERCPGGYLINGHQLCGRSGNRCNGRCAFHYRALTNETQPVDAAKDRAQSAAVQS